MARANAIFYLYADEICIDLMQIATAVGLIETRMQTMYYLDD